MAKIFRIKEKIDMTQIKDDKVVVLIGKRDTGKSFLCRDELYHHSIYLLVKLYLVQKVLINFIKKLYQNYLFMVNLHLK